MLCSLRTFLLFHVFKKKKYIYVYIALSTNIPGTGNKHVLKYYKTKRHHSNLARASNRWAQASWRLALSALDEDGEASIASWSTIATSCIPEAMV